MPGKKKGDVFNIPDTGIDNQNKIKSEDSFFPSMSPSESLDSISLDGSETKKGKKKEKDIFDFEI